MRTEYKFKLGVQTLRQGAINVFDSTEFALWTW